MTSTDSVSELIHELNQNGHRARPAVIIQPHRPVRPRSHKKTSMRVSKRKPGVRVTKRVVKG